MASNSLGKPLSAPKNSKTVDTSSKPQNHAKPVATQKSKTFKPRISKPIKVASTNNERGFSLDTRKANTTAVNQHYVPEAVVKKKIDYTKKQIGVVGEFPKKAEGGNPVGDNNVYETDRNVVPRIRPGSDDKPIGYDKDIEAADAKKQLARRKALKLIKLCESKVSSDRPIIHQKVKVAKRPGMIQNRNPLLSRFPLPLIIRPYVLSKTPGVLQKYSKSQQHRKLDLKPVGSTKLGMGKKHWAHHRKNVSYHEPKKH
jgi:hypothetical protein